MIVRPRPRFFELFFLLKGSILSRVAPQLITIFLFSLLMVVVERHVPTPFKSFSGAPFTLLGIAISIFLGFRNNACYDRWWEARRQLGQMIGEMRTLARLTVAFLPSPEDHRKIVRGLIGYTCALNPHLKGQPQPAENAKYLSPETVAAIAARSNPPSRILTTVTAHYVSALRSGTLTDIQFQTIEEHIAAVANIQVACERIASTPTPFTYTLLLHRTAYLFCFLLPTSLAGPLGFASPFFCTLIGYTFFGLDALGDQLEDPFGDHSNTLPLNALTRIVEISLLEAIGETNLPPYLQPIDHELR